nr:HSP90-like protein [Lingue ampelovirus 1]
MNPYEFMAGSRDISSLTDVINLRVKIFGNDIRFLKYVATWQSGVASLYGDDAFFLDRDVRTCLALSILTDAVNNTIYTHESVLASIKAYHVNSRYMLPILGKQLYQINEKYFNLTPAQLNQIKSLGLHRDEGDYKFLCLVSSYLGRPVNSSDLSSASNIPVAEVSYAAVGEGQGAKKLPKFLSAFMKLYSSVVDNFDDESKRTRMETYEPFAISVAKVFKASSVKHFEFCKHFEKLLSIFLDSTKPKQMFVEERIVWIKEAVVFVEKLAEVFFNEKLCFERNDLYSNITIFPHDPLHSLSKVFISVLSGREKETQTVEYNMDIDALVELAVAVRADNVKDRLLLSEALDCLLLYCSIHGTSMNRIARYPKTFEAVISRRPVSLNMEAVQRLYVKGKSDRVNHLRRACRCFADRTLALRKNVGLSYNPFAALRHVDGVYTFDFVNFCKARDNIREFSQIATISKWIAYGEKHTNDTYLGAAM